MNKCTKVYMEIRLMGDKLLVCWGDANFLPNSSHDLVMGDGHLGWTGGLCGRLEENSPNSRALMRFESGSHFSIMSSRASWSITWYWWTLIKYQTWGKISPAFEQEVVPIIMQQIRLISVGWLRQTDGLKQPVSLLPEVTDWWRFSPVGLLQLP